MRIKKEISVSTKVLGIAENLLLNRATELRGELLEVFDTLGKVTGKGEVHYLQELQEGVEFRIRILTQGPKPQNVKRKVGRPRKEKVNTNGSK